MEGEECPCSSECFIYEATEPISIKLGTVKLYIIKLKGKQNLGALRYPRQLRA